LTVGTSARRTASPCGDAFDADCCCCGGSGSFLASQLRDLAEATVGFSLPPRPARRLRHGDVAHVDRVAIEMFDSRLDELGRSAGRQRISMSFRTW